jgi:hypothetical protein
MRRAAIVLALCAFVSAVAPEAWAETATIERASVSFDTLGLVYGLAVGSPRVSAAASLPLNNGLSLQASPTAAWAGEGELEIELPLLARFAFRVGPLLPYAGAGLELGYARLPGMADIVATGPILEIGERFYLFKSNLFLEPYAGGALMLSWQGEEGPTVLPGAFGGLRIGLGL